MSIKLSNPYQTEALAKVLQTIPSKDVLHIGEMQYGVLCVTDVKVVDGKREYRTTYIDLDGTWKGERK